MKVLSFILFLIVVVSGGFAQEINKSLTLDEVLQLAKTQSLDAIIAQHRFRASYWAFRTHKAEFLPSLSFDTRLVDLKRSIATDITDGQEEFFYSNRLNSSGSLRIDQNIGLTGGSVYMTSDLSVLNNLNDGVTSFMSTPVIIGFTQPLFGFNSSKWQKKIEPLKYEEAKKNYLASAEDISIKAVGLFFDLVLAQINLKIAELNIANNDTLYKIAKGRYNIGTISKDEVLQMELSLLNARAAHNQTKLDLEVKKSSLRSFLGFNDKVSLELIVPEEIPDTKINIALATEEARKNSPQILQYERQVIESEREVAFAKSEKRPTVKLSGAFGLTKDAYSFTSSYKNPNDAQTAIVAINVPIIDWGLGKGKYRMAKSSEEVVKASVKQQLIDFEQNIFLQIMQFNLQDEQCLIARKADTIANLRYDVALQRFYIGKIDVLKLNIALTDKDAAKRNYISALRTYWNYYFNIRRLTLYDFEKNSPLETEFNDLLY